LENDLRFTIFKIVNRFPNLKSLSLYPRLWESITAMRRSLLVTRIYRRKYRILVSDYQNPMAMVGRWNPATSSCHHWIPTEPERNLVEMIGFQTDLAKMAEIQQDLVKNDRIPANIARFRSGLAWIRPNWIAGHRQQWSDIAEFRFPSLITFLYEPNTRKYFRKNYFL
jgi:hypothetical protein